jgi:ion channel-forming bestrophin family protein
MIKYDPHDWLSHLFDIQGTVIREIMGRVLICGAWSIAAVGAYELAGRSDFSLAIPETGHTLVGVALGLLLVLRTNASYDRYWEGRKQWGTIVNASRNLARTASLYLAPAPELVRTLLAWTAAFSRGTVHHLRGKESIGSDSGDLPADEIQAVLAEGRLPLAIARRMTSVIVAGHERRLISDIQQATLDQNVQQLVDAFGACERIHKTPMPFAYVVHLRRALILYLATLPFALVGRFGWLTVPAVLLIAYNVLGIEEIGVEIEDPFGEQENDLPLEEICGMIDADLRGIVATLPASRPASSGTGES